jgi:glycosyltransferase involved in cell wall biosynthesis
MKLLFYSHSFAPNIGGVESIALSLLCGLVDRRAANGPRFDLTVATQTPAADFNDGGLPFPVVRRPNTLQLWDLIRTADVVHLAGPALLPLVLTHVSRRPLVVEHHGYQAICLNGVLVQQPAATICPGHFQAGNYSQCLRCRARETSWWRSVVDLLAMFPRHYLARHAARNIAISAHVQRRHVLPNATVIYYGLEKEPPRGNSFNLISSANRKVRFAYVGRLVPEKGLPVLLRAAELLKSKLNQFEILFVGDGPERHSLERLAQQTGLREIVRCTGFLSGATLTRELRDVDVVVMPSAWEETAGLAAIEQMMRGRLVIASRIGGLGEIVGDAGLTFESGNAPELAQCLDRVLENPSLIDTFGGKARERAQQLFLRERMIAEHVAVYVEACRHRAK